MAWVSSSTGFQSVRVKLATAGLACLLAGAACGLWTTPRSSEIVYVNVGQGDCTLYRLDGRNVLVDVGPKHEGFDAAERLAIPDLHSRGIAAVDMIVLSHPDLDHIGGLASMLEAYPMARVAASVSFRESSKMRTVLTEAAVAEGSVLWLPHDSVLTCGEWTLRIVCPRWSPPGNDNEGSVFMKVSNGACSAVTSGDASAEVEATVGQAGDWSAQVMHLGHHGSRTSTGEAWLNDVRPAYCLVSCGQANRYGHPDPETLNRVLARHIAVMRTDKSGDIEFVPTPQGYRPLSPMAPGPKR